MFIDIDSSRSPMEIFCVHLVNEIKRFKKFSTRNPLGLLWIDSYHYNFFAAHVPTLGVVMGSPRGTKGAADLEAQI